MNPVEKLRLAKNDLGEAIDAHDDAVKRLEDQQRGQPGSSLGGGGGRSGASPVETALGIGGPGEDGGIRGDYAARNLDEIDRLRKNICRDTRLLAVILGSQVPKAPTDKQRREVERANSAEVAECWWMRKHTNSFEPALCTSNLGGMLDQERPVCRWVYDFARSKERMPTAEECQRHASGQTVRVGA